MPKRSAGLLLWRRGPAGIQVLLAHPGGPLFARKDDGHWSIPKGEYDADEEPLTAAYREFTEEIGSAPPSGDAFALGEHDQGGGRKVNTIWALEGDLDVSTVQSNSFVMEWPPRSGRMQEFPEIDRAEWFDDEVARRKLFGSQLVFLDRLSALLAHS